MFAYGMNTNLQEMAERCPAAKPLCVAVLQNRRFDFRFHADLTYVHGSTVEGVLWSIDAQTLDILDIVEGYPFYYIRKQFYVLADGKKHLAWIYLMKDPANLQLPDASYWNNVVNGYKENNLNMEQLHSALKRAK